MGKNIQIAVQSFSDTAPRIRRALGKNRNKPVSIDGFLYLQAGETVYSCEESPEADTLLSSVPVCNSPDEPAAFGDELWRRALRGSAEIEALEQQGAVNRLRRNVIVFRPKDGTGNMTLQEGIPLQDSDKMVSMGNGDFALVLNMKNKSGDEVAEYAAAVTETMESEAGIPCSAGIGRPVDTLDKLCRCYRDACDALTIGARYRMPGNVFAYDRQKVERLADFVPPDKASDFYQEIVSADIEKILTDEMTETIRVFFRNDLNLSNTARQLFIHRNTLIYRIEKIRKATGLDLKKFEDAVVFRFIMSFSNRQEK